MDSADFMGGSSVFMLCPIAEVPRTTQPYRDARRSEGSSIIPSCETALVGSRNQPDQGRSR